MAIAPQLQPLKQQLQVRKCWFVQLDWGPCLYWICFASTGQTREVEGATRHCCVDPFLTDFVLRGCKTAQFMQELSSARGTALLSEFIFQIISCVSAPKLREKGVRRCNHMALPRQQALECLPPAQQCHLHLSQVQQSLISQWWWKTISQRRCQTWMINPLLLEKGLCWRGFKALETKFGKELPSHGVLPQLLNATSL